MKPATASVLCHLLVGLSFSCGWAYVATSAMNAAG